MALSSAGVRPRWLPPGAPLLAIEMRNAAALPRCQRETGSGRRKRTRVSFCAMIRSTLALLAVLTACTPPASIDTLRSGDGTADKSRDSIVSLPVTDETGVLVPIQTRICRPTSDAPAPLVVINHGSPPNAAARPRMQLRRCDEEATRWFLARGYAVAFPLRRGYGANGGSYPEASGDCSEASYVHAGLESARDNRAAVDQLTTLPFIRPDHVVVLGQSAGGWGTDAYDSLPHPKVIAFISMAGGRGGHARMLPNNNCHPEHLAEAAGRFGATATTPMLWIYTANDSFFGPSIAAAMHATFTAAGGRAEFVQLGPYDGDGHNLFFGPGGSAIWGPPVERYLAAQNALP